MKPEPGKSPYLTAKFQALLRRRGIKRKVRAAASPVTRPDLTCEKRGGEEGSVGQ